MRFCITCNTKVSSTFCVHQSFLWQLLSIECCSMAKSAINCLPWHQEILDRNGKRTTRAGKHCMSSEWIPPSKNEPSWGASLQQRYSRGKMNRVEAITTKSKIPPTSNAIHFNTSNGIQQENSPRTYNKIVQWLRYRRGKMNRVGVVEVCATSETNKFWNRIPPKE